jgi:hypothetical protein
LSIPIQLGHCLLSSFFLNLPRLGHPPFSLDRDILQNRNSAPAIRMTGATHPAGHQVESSHLTLNTLLITWFGGWGIVGSWQGYWRWVDDDPGRYNQTHHVKPVREKAENCLFAFL